MTASTATPTALPVTKKRADLTAEVRAAFTAIKEAQGTVALKSSEVFLAFDGKGPRYLDLVRAYGTKLGFGYYSLEHYFGEKKADEPATPVSEARPGVKVWKDRAKKGSTAVAANFDLSGLAPVNVFAAAEVVEEAPVSAPEVVEAHAPVQAEAAPAKSKGRGKRK